MEKNTNRFLFQVIVLQNQLLLLQPIPRKRQRLAAADGMKPPLGPQACSLLSSTANAQLLLTGTTGNRTTRIQSSPLNGFPLWVNLDPSGKAITSTSSSKRFGTDIFVFALLLLFVFPDLFVCVAAVCPMDGFLLVRLPSSR